MDGLLRRFEGESSQFLGTQAKVDTPAPALNEINGRLENIKEQVAKLASRLQQTADRALGAAPSPVTGTGNGANKPPQLGQASVAFDSLRDIAELVGYAHDQAQRLENVA